VLECPQPWTRDRLGLSGPSGKDVVRVPKTRPPYPEEFRREAVVLIHSGQQSLAEASRSLGISRQTLVTGSCKRQSTRVGRKA
jgi:transposase-like protein